jgi:hypothetical protein
VALHGRISSSTCPEVTGVRSRFVASKLVTFEGNTANTGEGSWCYRLPAHVYIPMHHIQLCCTDVRATQSHFDCAYSGCMQQCLQVAADVGGEPCRKHLHACGSAAFRKHGMRFFMRWLSRCVASQSIYSSTAAG